MKKALSIIISILFALILVINLIAAFNIPIFGIKIFKVASGSMEPTLLVNNLILVKESSKYNIGDIVTYKYDDSYITHRIVSIDNEEIITKGDANNTEDEGINVTDIKGKVILSGGILNIVIDYKFVIIGFMLTIYLITYYLDSNEEIKIEK
jgi:signal peptidase I